MSNAVQPNQESLLNHLRTKYGELLTLDEVAEVLRYKSVDAVRKAHSRKSLPVTLYRFQGRAGYFARADEIADCINNIGS